MPATTVETAIAGLVALLEPLAIASPEVMPIRTVFDHPVSTAPGAEDLPCFIIIDPELRSGPEEGLYGAAWFQEVWTFPVGLFLPTDVNRPAWDAELRRRFVHEVLQASYQRSARKLGGAVMMHESGSPRVLRPTAERIAGILYPAVLFEFDLRVGGDLE
jgi:hypothetical protein